MSDGYKPGKLLYSNGILRNTDNRVSRGMNNRESGLRVERKNRGER